MVRALNRPSVRGTTVPHFPRFRAFSAAGQPQCVAMLVCGIRNLPQKRRRSGHRGAISSRIGGGRALLLERSESNDDSAAADWARTMRYHRAPAAIPSDWRGKRAASLARPVPPKERRTDCVDHLGACALSSRSYSLRPNGVSFAEDGITAPSEQTAHDEHMPLRQFTLSRDHWPSITHGIKSSGERKMTPKTNRRNPP